MPVPVITNTLFPSVTGEGEDIFCLRILTLPSPKCFFQITAPCLRSRRHRNNELPSATLRKIASSQMIGVAPLQLGIGAFHVTFSVVVQWVGKFFSLLTPFKVGPRHWGQFSAVTNQSGRKVNNSKETRLTKRISPQDTLIHGLSTRTVT